MATGRLYFDHNATAPLLAAAKSAMCDAMDLPGNPSSVHAEGRKARAVIEVQGKVSAVLEHRSESADTTSRSKP